MAGLDLNYQRRLMALAIQKLRKERSFVAEVPVILCCLGGLIGWWGLPCILATCYGYTFGVGDIQSALLWSSVGVTIGASIGGATGTQIFYRAIRPFLKSAIIDVVDKRFTQEKGVA